MVLLLHKQLHAFLLFPISNQGPVATLYSDIWSWCVMLIFDRYKGMLLIDCCKSHDGASRWSALI